MKELRDGITLVVITFIASVSVLWNGSALYWRFFIIAIACFTYGVLTDD